MSSRVGMTEASTTNYAPMIYNPPSCRCGAHRQHRIFRYLWQNPSVPMKRVAAELKISESNVKEGLWELRQRKDLARRCPECFAPQLLNGVCQACGFEPDSPSLRVDVMSDSHSPVNHLHPGNLLGTEVRYSGFSIQGEDWTGNKAKIRLNNWGVILDRKIEGKLEENLVREAKSDVMEALKAYYPADSITDEAGRLVVKEVLEFQARYPGLRPKGLGAAITSNVLARLELRHPQLRGVRMLGRQPKRERPSDVAGWEMQEDEERLGS